MDFDDLKAELNGQSDEDTRKADEAEIHHRLAAEGIDSCSPAEAMKRVSERFSPTLSGLGIPAIRDAMMAMSVAEVKQALYELKAAIAGASSLHDAVVAIALTKALQGEEGFKDMLPPGFPEGMM